MEQASEQLRVRSASDIRRDSWIERLVPAPAHPYARLMRLDRPIGIWLLLFPCWWGLFLAENAEPSPIRAILPLMLLFAVGSVVMRGAGCTYNDIVDREFDARVARTAMRPIPSGQVSVRQAVIFLAAQLFVGFLILLMFNRSTILLGMLSLLLVFTYPLMKRITYWPQAFLGLTFNWGILMGWSAATGGIGAPAIVLYAGAVAWTLHYDTIYGHQDKEDDLLVGVKSTALRLGSQTKAWLVVFSITTVAFFGIGVALAGAHWPAFLAVLGVALHLAWQIARVDLDSPSDCRDKFRSNRWIGWILLAGIVASQWLR